MKKHLNLILGILIGVLANDLYLKHKKKSTKKCGGDCGCGGKCGEHSHGDTQDGQAAPSKNSECEEAVKQIMSERQTLIRMTPEAYQKMYDEELRICMETE